MNGRTHKAGTGRNNPRRSPVCFTLIEMLVVVSIIGILAMLLFPGVSGALNRGKTAMCVDNIRNLTIAHIMFMSTHNGTMPSSSEYLGMTGGTMDNGNIAPQHSFLITEGYLGNDLRVFKCPLDRGNRVTTWCNPPYHNVSYMRNENLEWELHTVRRPSQQFMVAEEAEWSPFNDGYITSTSPYDCLTLRHRYETSVMSFLDGHVRDDIDSQEWNHGGPNWQTVHYYAPQE